MASKNFLNSISIPKPCSADWNSMIGNDQVRFCNHCSLDVHNLSAMTRSQAERLVARSNGRLCVQYHSDGSGHVQTSELGKKLHRINRRVSQIAAGAFSATLSLTSAMAQQGASSAGEEPTLVRIARPNTRWSAGASVAGTITDQQGAVIPGATIFLTNGDGQVSMYASTGFDGQFKIGELRPGGYKIRIDAPGFSADETDGVYLQENTEIRVDRSLTVAKIEETVDVEETEVSFRGGGVVAYVEPAHPFVRAAQEDNLEEVTALIAGIDVNLRDKRSRTTALEHAVKNGNREMTQLLLSAGAKVNAQNSEGETVLMMLDDDSTSDLVWDLLNAGANTKLKDQNGNTALIQIADRNNLDALRTLLEAGAEVDAKNKEGETALMRAAAGGLVNSVRALVLAGANITAIDDNEMSALTHALDNDHAAVGRFLKSKGAVEAVAQVKKEE